MPIFTGVLLAEISMTTFHTSILSGRRIVRLLPFALLTIGWYLISFPNKFQKRMAWSDHMLNAGLFLFPTNSDIHAFYSHIGATFIITAVVFSSFLQKVFNLRGFQWLGARSFPIYLVHGPVLRSFLNWILFPSGSPLIPLEETDPETGKVVRVLHMHPMPPIGRFVWALPLFLIVTLVLSDLWLKYVEPLCGRIAKKIEERMLTRQPPQMQLHSEKLETIQEFPLAESSYSNPHSPFSRATTPTNEVEMILPR
jgi:peptidoglycan/LPS O-acetylase OafA/YrhL